MKRNCTNKIEEKDSENYAIHMLKKREKKSEEQR